MNRRKLLKKLAQGDLRNVAFTDMVALVSGFGFTLKRTSGSHHIFAHPGIPELLNLQEVAGEAKPYQIRQFLRLIEKYNINLED
ncbi:MAG: type II toxin-antitoxin system HicA family toxin [Desulfobaccales bacterium]